MVPVVGRMMEVGQEAVVQVQEVQEVQEVQVGGDGEGVATPISTLIAPNH